MNKLKIIVNRIDECGNIETESIIVNRFDIEKAVDNHAEYMKEFKVFTGEVGLIGFRHVGGNTRIDQSIPSKITWKNDTIEITAHDFENAHITIYFTIINEDEEEIELSLMVSTSFSY